MTGSTIGAALLAAGFALQPPGIFHGDEPVARDGERWLALHVDARGAALVATRVDVRPVVDEILDGPGERSGLQVGSPLDAASTRAFVRGPALSAGPVAQARVASHAGAQSPLDAAQAIDFGGRHYRLSVRCEGARVEVVDRQPQRGCRLVLDDGRTTQALGTVLAYRTDIDGRAVWTSEQVPMAVVFAGDLDRDGRLDLLLDLPGADHGRRTALLLSSQAAAGALVGAVAGFEATGC